jgi:hypothetical protein
LYLITPGSAVLILSSSCKSLNPGYPDSDKCFLKWRFQKPEFMLQSYRIKNQYL